MEEKDNEFISFKKVIIFGTEGSGKSTLTNSLETGKFSEQTHSENSNLI
jgi:GTPase SAR1 family protein